MSFTHFIGGGSTNSAAAVFDGTAYGASALIVPGLGDITDLTVECWFKHTNAAQTERYVLVVYAGSTESLMFYWISGLWTFYVRTDSTHTDAGSYSMTPVIGRWYHIAAAFSGATNTTNWYVNGVNVNTDTSLSSSGYTDQNNCYIKMGTERTSSTNLKGWLDDVRVWSDVRTPTEIATNFQKEIPTDSSNLLMYWKANSNLNDSTTNAYNLTATGVTYQTTSLPF